MMFATLVEKTVCTPNDWTEYLRVVLSVEIGYGLKIITTNIFKKELMEKCEALPLFTRVKFSGYFAEKANFFRMQTLDEAEFEQCEKCFMCKADPCTGCLKNPSEHISGEWQVADIKTINENFKITFTQEDNVLCRWFFPKTLFYKVCNSLQVTDMVKLEGWRDYDIRHSYFNRLEKCAL